MSSHSEGNAESFQDHIAKATLRLVTARGADRVAMSDVVRLMGTTRVAMARYCPTESDLWRTTVAFIEQRMIASWETILSSGQSPSERLRSLVAVQIGLIMSMPALRDMLFSREFHGSGTALHRGLAGVRMRFQSLLRQVIRDGVGVGQFPRSLDPEKTALRIAETLQGMVVSWSLDSRGDDVIEEAWARLDALVGNSAPQRAIAPMGTETGINVKDPER